MLLQLLTFNKLYHQLFPMIMSMKMMAMKQTKLILMTGVSFIEKIFLIMKGYFVAMRTD